jgi:anaerobic ribonucleoside-triphosphate reductase
MHQILLTLKKMNFQILEEINDIEKDNSELQLFDKIKTINQINAKCIIIKNALKKREELKRNVIQTFQKREKHFILSR